MITLERMISLEANSAWRGFDRRLMMENAGSQVINEILDRFSSEKSTTVVACTGNNGGDGLVAARKLVSHNFDVRLVLLGKPDDITSSQSQANWEVLSDMKEDIDFEIIRDSSDLSEELVDSDILVDAMLGTGISGELREPVSSAVDLINESDSIVVAVDVPTGVDPSTGEVHYKATMCDLTVTFHDLKPGLEKAEEEYVGEVVSVPIGIPSSAEKKTGPGDVMMAIPRRSKNSHKGQNGRLLVIGGGSQYVGAPALTALAALKSGVDLVTVSAPQKTAELVSSYSPTLITQKLPAQDFNKDCINEVKEKIEESSALILGPGIGTKEETAESVIELLESILDRHSDLPILLDADGLKIISKEERLIRKGNFVLTPHAGEFEILTGQKPSEDVQIRASQAAEVAEKLGSTIMLKGKIDICANSDGDVTLNDTGNPGMTAGGTGDVLAGITGAFLSQNADPYAAGKAGFFLSGLAGDICSESMGYEFTAIDVKERISNAISKARKYW